MVRKIEWFFLSGLILIVAGIGLNWALKGAIHFQKDILVPDMVGKSLAEALEILSAQNLGLKKEGTEFNESVPAGTVLRQQPFGGALVKEGKIIRITISQGSETVYVPELTGESLRSAEIALRTNFLSLGEIRTQPSVKFEKELVIYQEPSAKKIVPKNSLVHLTVSAGPPQDGTLLMPDFVGKNWKEVQSWSKETGIKANRVEDASSASDFETVIQQDIPGDTPMQKSDIVKCVVSTNKHGGTSPVGASVQRSPPFHYEVPQSESSKHYVFRLVDSSMNQVIYDGNPPPGSKLNIVIPVKVSPAATIRVFVNGILTEEKSLQ